MKTSILLGIAASILAFIMGTGLSDTAASEASPAPSPEPSQRMVTEILIHQAAETSYDESIPVSVTISGTQQDMSLNDYLTGVVLGEMPASFDLEALKAQAVAARTYTLKHLMDGKTLSDDSSVCQAYLPVDTASSENLQKVREAVEATDGQVLTYDGALITATYFSCSGGQTEDASAVWGGSVPYLVSVDSPGEEFAAVFESTVSIPRSDFLSALGISDAAVSAVTYTAGGGVDTITIGGKVFSGTELRNQFSLRSTIFTLSTGQDTVEFSVRGNGHRVGMSQYGAQAMAEAGSTYEEILTHYYTGVTITELEA